MARALANRLWEARKYAAALHEAEAQTYRGRPYVCHLDDVRNVAFEVGIADEGILVATLLHDVLEDTMATPRDVYDRFGKRVLDLVKAVTDPEGANRAERKESSNRRIRTAGTAAILLKLCDRLANARRSAENPEGHHWHMYKAEYPAFRAALNRHHEKPTRAEVRLWRELDALFGFVEEDDHV